MAEAEAVTESVLEEYRSLEARGAISQQHRDRLRQRKAALYTGTAGSTTGACTGGRSLGGGTPTQQQQSFFDPQLTARPVQLFPAF